MPIYLVEGPDGRTHKIEGPVGATPEQVIAQAQKLIPYEQRTVVEQPTIDWREAGLGTMAKRGFNRAMTGLGSTVTDLIPALAGSALGFKDYAAEQLAEHKAKMEASEAQNPTAFKSFRDVRGVGDAVGFVAETFGELIPDIVALMTGAGAASVVGRRVALKGVEKLIATRAAEVATARGLEGEAAAAFTKTFTEKMAERAAPVIARVGAEGSATGLKYGLPASSYALNAPDVFGSIYEKTEEQSPGIAALMGVPIAMLDTFLPGQILSKLGMAGKAKLGMAIISDSKVLPGSFKAAALKELGTVVAAEGLTESAQEALTIAAEMMAGAKGDFFSQENIDRILNSTLKGAIGGGAFGGPGAIRSGLQAKGEKDRLAGEAAARTEEEPPAPPAQLENKPFVPVVFPDGSVATTPEQVKAYEESLFQQKFAPQPADVAPPLALENRNAPIEGVTPVVFPDGSVATTPEQVKAYEESLFQQEFAPPPANVSIPPAPSELEGPQPSPEKEALTAFKVTDSTLLNLGFNKGAIRTSRTAKELRGLDLTTFDGLAAFEETLQKTKTKYDPQAAATLIDQARNLQYEQQKQKIPDAAIIGAQPYTATEQQEIEFAQQRRAAGLPIAPRQEYLLQQYAPQIALLPQPVSQPLVTQPSVGSGPRAKEAKRGTTTNTPAGKSTVVPSQPAPSIPPGGAAASGTGGVGGAAQSAGTASVGEGAQPGALTTGSAVEPGIVHKLALAEQRNAGWDSKWPFIPADMLNADFRHLIATDPELTAVEKEQIFQAGKNLGVVSKSESVQQAAADKAAPAKAEPKRPIKGFGAGKAKAADKAAADKAKQQAATDKAKAAADKAKQQAAADKAKQQAAADKAKQQAAADKTAADKVQREINKIALNDKKAKAAADEAEQQQNLRSEAKRILTAAGYKQAEITDQLAAYDSFTPKDID
jgi:hypothetical protein